MFKGVAEIGQATEWPMFIDLQTRNDDEKLYYIKLSPPEQLKYRRRCTVVRRQMK